MSRRDSVRALALAGGAGVLVAAVVLARGAFRRAGTAAAPSATPLRPSLPPDPKACAALQDRYDAAWEKANRCASDAECMATPRGGAFLALDGCARFGPRSALPEADALAAEWLEAGCADDFDACAGTPASVCRAGKCEERAPPPLPATWRRVDVARAFTLFLPPDLVETKVYPEDSVVRLWRSDRMRVSLDYGYYSNKLDEHPPEGVVSPRKETTIGGQRAFIRTVATFPDASKPRTSVAVHVPHVPRSARATYSEGAALTLFATCDGPPPCADGESLIRSIRFFGSGLR